MSAAPKQKPAVTAAGIKERGTGLKNNSTTLTIEDWYQLTFALGAFTVATENEAECYPGNPKIEASAKDVQRTLSEFTNLRACAVDCLKMLPPGYDQWPIQEAIGNLQSRVPPRDFDSESSLLALEHLIYDDGIIAESIVKAEGPHDAI